jgi:hypothetical protein
MAHGVCSTGLYNTARGDGRLSISSSSHNYLLQIGSSSTSAPAPPSFLVSQDNRSQQLKCIPRVLPKTKRKLYRLYRRMSCDVEVLYMVWLIALEVGRRLGVEQGLPQDALHEVYVVIWKLKIWNRLRDRSWIRTLLICVRNAFACVCAWAKIKKETTKNANRFVRSKWFPYYG